MKHTITSLLRTPRLALAMLPLFALPCVAADPAAVLPDESVAYMEIDSQVFSMLDEHPVMKALPLKELENLMLKMSGSTPEENAALEKKIGDALGIPLEELQKKTGRMAVSIHDLKIPENPSPENIGGEFSLAYEFDGDEAFFEKMFDVMLTQILAQVEKQAGPQAEQMKEFFSKGKDMFEHSTAEHAGAKIHVFKLKDTDETKGAPAFIREWAYAVHDKMILGSSGQDGVEEMLDRLKSGANTGSLAASAIYKKDHEKAGKTLALASLNLETILGLVEKFALPMADNSEVDVKKVWTVLGADKLQSLVLALGAEAETVDITGLLTYSAKPGLFGILAVPGPGTPPAFLPKTLAAASYQQIDFEKTLDNAIKLAAQIYPPAEQVVEMGLTAAKGQVGVDIRKDILGQLGPDLWAASMFSDEKKDATPDTSNTQGLAFMALLGANGVMGVRVKDSKAFGLALDTIINKVASREAVFETREYQGFTINNVKEAPAEMPVGYVLTDEWLILNIGGPEALEQVLARLSKPGDDGLFAQKAVTKTLESMRGGQVATTAGKMSDYFKSTLGTLEMLMKQAAGSGAPEIPFDELGKLLDVPLIMVDKTWLEDTHFEYRVRIAPPGE